MIHVNIANGRLPALGFGTWALDGDVAYRMVRAALDVGYRHVDTAQMYGNETEVGRALADLVAAHYEAILSFYGADLGLRVARKHLGWYMAEAGTPKPLRQEILTARTPEAVLARLPRAFDVPERQAA